MRVFYDGGHCLHFAECVRGLPQVFDVGSKRPWIQPRNASPEQVVEVERRCPSGAQNEPFCDKACSSGWSSEEPTGDND